MMKRKIKNSDKIILDLCGGTGAWSRPYKEAGYDVRVITLPDYDVRTYEPPENVYGILAAPPCTEFSFAKSRSKKPRNLAAGMEIVLACLSIIWRCQYELPTPLAKRTKLTFWALENPYGLLIRMLGKPALTFQPFYFGDLYQKKTCLWGFFNTPQMGKKINEIDKNYIQDMGRSRKNGNKFGVSAEKLGDLNLYNPLFNRDGYKLPIEMDKRAARRAITPPGFAKAFFKVNR
jgi:hypothetical protein